MADSDEIKIFGVNTIGAQTNKPLNSNNYRVYYNNMINTVPLSINRYVSPLVF